MNGRPAMVKGEPVYAFQAEPAFFGVIYHLKRKKKLTTKNLGENKTKGWGNMNPVRRVHRSLILATQT